MAEEFYKYIRNYFGNWGPVYDLMQIPISTTHEEVVRFTDAPKSAIVLDVATGTGRQAFAFAKQGYQVIGVDLLKGMLRVAQKKNTYDRASFELADATRLPFPDRSFDVTCISFALHDMAADIRGNVLREMTRVTAQNGVIVIVDYATPPTKLGRWFIKYISPFFETKYLREFMSVDFAALLRSSGMTVVAVRPVLRGIGNIIKATPHTKKTLKRARVSEKDHTSR